MSLSTAQTERQPAPPALGTSIASSRLLHAAMSGLLAAGAAGCSDSDDKASTKGAQAELDDEELDAVCEDRVDSAVKKVTGDDAVDELCSDKVKAAEDSCDAQSACADQVRAAEDKAKAAAMMCEKPDATKLCADMVKAADDKCKPFTATSEEKTTSSEQKNYKFSELTKKCDERGGYVQIHAACGSVGSCAGFSFGDWGPDGATVTEHTCSGSNGCLGLSCVVLPKDQGRTGKDIYTLKYEEPGPGTCSGCHAVHNDDDSVDATKFYVYVQEGSTRTKANWLERSAAEQERVTAFGVHGTLPNGLAYNHMSPYYKLLSRKEIERVVQHLRTLTPIIQVIKNTDVPPMQPAP